MIKLFIKSICFLLLATSISACDDEASFTSMAGEWTYTFPDEKVSVTFTISGSQFENYHISKALIEYGDLTQSSFGLTDMKARSLISRMGDQFLSITFQFAAPQGTGGTYTINLEDPRLSNDFLFINISNATYMMSPNGTSFSGNSDSSPEPIKRK